MPEPPRGEGDRARGALVGLAIGDALGIPGEGLPFAVVHERFGLVERFVASPPDNPVSPGRAAGEVTDDTDQAVIVGRLLVEGNGRLDPRDLARELLGWEARMRTEGSHNLLGPSTRRALARVADGVSPDDSGRGGDTNGAAMRIAPLGICCPVESDDDLPELVDRVAAVCRVTHNTGLAIAGASAVAAAVSAGVSGLGMRRALELAVRAADLGSAYGEFSAGADVVARVTWALELVQGRTPPEALDVVVRLVGTSVATQESVPAALAMASMLGDDDAWLVVRSAASLGGDSDTIAAMAGAVCGAVAGLGAFPASVRDELAAANPALDLVGLADELVAVRRAR